MKFNENNRYAVLRGGNIVDEILDINNDVDYINYIFDNPLELNEATIGDDEHKIINITNIEPQPEIGWLYACGIWVDLNSIKKHQQIKLKANALIDKTNRFDTLSFQKKYWTLEQEAEFEQFRSALFDVVYENSNTLPITPDFVNEIL